MSSYVAAPTFTAQASAANIAQYARVKLSSGKLVLAGDEVHIGTLVDKTLAADAYVAVLAPGMGATSKYIAGAAVTAGAAVYSAANGKVTSTAAAVRIGVALNAAAADGDIIEVVNIITERNT